MSPLDTTEPPGTDSDVTSRVADVLAGYLRSAGRGMGPGTDGMTVAEAVRAFYQGASLGGQVPGPAELVRLGVEVWPQTGWQWLKDLGFQLVVPRRRHPKAATPEQQQV